MHCDASIVVLSQAALATPCIRVTRGGGFRLGPTHVRAGKGYLRTLVCDDFTGSARLSPSDKGSNLSTISVGLSEDDATLRALGLCDGAELASWVGEGVATSNDLPELSLTFVNFSETGTTKTTTKNAIYIMVIAMKFMFMHVFFCPSCSAYSKDSITPTTFASTTVMESATNAGIPQTVF